MFSAALLLVMSVPVAQETNAAFKFVRCSWTDHVDGATTNHQLSLNILGTSWMANRIQGTHSRQTTLEDGTFFHSFTELGGRYAGTSSGAGRQFVDLQRGRVVDNAEGDIRLRGALQALSLEMVNINGERGFSYRLQNYLTSESQEVSAQNCMFNNLSLLK